MNIVKKGLPIIVLFILLAACTSQESTASCQPPGCIVYGLTLNVSGIDPHINRSTELGIVLRSVYDTLVYRDPQSNEFVPGLAEAWQISEDGLIYDFSLKQNVQFHDGTPFDAEALAANFKRILAPETASQRSRFLLQSLASYQVMDEYTFRIKLVSPFSPLLDSLSQVYLGIASPTALAKFEDDVLRYQFHQVGTGPFKFVEYLPEERIVIERNPEYSWGPAFYDNLPENAVQRIEFRFFRDPATRLIALQNGDAQIMGEIPPNDARTLVNSPDITLEPVAIPGQPLQFYMNTKQTPTDDLAVRQALIYSVNRAVIVEAVYGEFSTVAWGPISGETLFYNRGVVNVYAYNFEQAQGLLRDAGYADADGDSILDRDGEPLQLKLLQPPWGLVPQVVQFLQDQWRSLGIQVDIVQVPGYVALLEAAAEDDYNLISFDQPGIDPYILNQAFLSDSSDNWSKFQSTELDSLLLEAAQSSDFEERRLAYGRAQAIIMEQALILPIRDYVNLNAYDSNIVGLEFDSYGWFPLLYGLSYEEV